jgi:hypothetical protein
LKLPLPVPAPEPEIVIHGALDVPVQPQPPCEVTETVPGPPAGGKDCEGGVAVYVHEPPACVTLNACPPIVSVPVLGLVV